MNFHLLVIIIILANTYAYMSKNYQKFLDISYKYVDKYPQLKKMNYKILYNGYKPWVIHNCNNYIIKNKIHLSNYQYKMLRYHCLLGLIYGIKNYDNKDDFKKYIVNIINNEFWYGYRCIKY